MKGLNQDLLTNQNRDLSIEYEINLRAISRDFILFEILKKLSTPWGFYFFSTETVKTGLNECNTCPEVVFISTWHHSSWFILAAINHPAHAIRHVVSPSHMSHVSMRFLRVFRFLPTSQKIQIALQGVNVCIVSHPKESHSQNKTCWSV